MRRRVVGDGEEELDDAVVVLDSEVARALLLLAVVRLHGDGVVGVVQLHGDGGRRPATPPLPELVEDGLAAELVARVAPELEGFGQPRRRQHRARVVRDQHVHLLESRLLREHLVLAVVGAILARYVELRQMRHRIVLGRVLGRVLDVLEEGGDAHPVDEVDEHGVPRRGHLSPPSRVRRRVRRLEEVARVRHERVLGGVLDECVRVQQHRAHLGLQRHKRVVLGRRLLLLGGLLRAQPGLLASLVLVITIVITVGATGDYIGDYTGSIGAGSSSSTDDRISFLLGRTLGPEHGPSIWK